MLTLGQLEVVAVGARRVDWGCRLTPDGALPRRAKSVMLLQDAVVVVADGMRCGDAVQIELDLCGSTILVARGRVSVVAVARDRETAVVELIGLGEVERSIIGEAMADPPSPSEGEPSGWGTVGVDAKTPFFGGAP